jgi:hypothetical protein
MIFRHDANVGVPANFGFFGDLSRLRGRQQGLQNVYSLGAGFDWQLKPVILRL